MLTGFDKKAGIRGGKAGGHQVGEVICYCGFVVAPTIRDWPFVGPGEIGT